MSAETEMPVIETPKLYIRLLPGRRFESTIITKEKFKTGTVLAHFAGSDGWDWYHVRFDATPDLIHQHRRDGMYPLKENWKPVYEAKPTKRPERIRITKGVTV